MSQNLEDFSPVKLKNKKLQKGAAAASIAIVVVLIFGSGWAFGRGNVTLSGLRDGNLTTDTSSGLNYSSVNELYNQLKANYDGTLDQTNVLDGLKSGLASSAGDPYTEYFNAKDSKAFQDQLNGNFEGIGAELGMDANKNVQIISPLAGSPAEKAGVQPKDIITKIDGKTTQGMTVDAAVGLIRGKAGTDVKLELVRAGALVEVTITRAQITVPSVTWKEDGTIGILTVSRFGDDTSALVAKAAAEFNDKKVTGIVLDLRSDPGGLLDSAVKLSSQWLDEGKTVLLEKRGGKVEHTYTALGNPSFKGVKTVALINAGSASASEITAGALHDNKAATLIGEKSYGKGSVQQVLNLAGGGTLKVTIARWYTPDDINIDKQGINPDKIVVQSPQDTANNVDTQLQAALSRLR